MQERWNKVREIFEEALDLPEAERDAFVRRVSTDEELRLEVLRLLNNVEPEDEFLDARPAVVASAILGHFPEAPLLSTGWLLADRFRIERFLGRGGMGEVYEAWDSQSDSVVALKTIRAGVTETPETIARLRSELLLARSVTHRNVCRVFDLHVATIPEAENRELVFLTMELLRGETLGARLKRDGALSTRETRELVRQLTSGLAAAHDAGVVHGDLKPSNIMLVPMDGTDAWRVVIMDFGIAAATGIPMVSLGGSPGYAAPEQLEHRELSPAVDIYALGALIKETITGRGLAAGKGAVPKVLPAEWRRIVRRCMSADPAQRYRSAAEVAKAASVRTTAYQAVFAILLLLSVAAVAASVSGVFQAKPQRAPAVAVLGFRDLSGRPGSSYLSLLISLALDADLARTGGIRVLPAEDVTRSKTELSVQDSDVLRPELRDRLRSNLRADVLVMGSYSFPQTAGQIHLEVVAVDARSGRQLAAVNAWGNEANLPGLVSRAGSNLRAQLRFEPAPGDADRVADALPGSLEAMRLYSEGLRQLRSFDALQATDSLQKAIAAEPDFALAHFALASAWAALGYERRAEEEDKKALDLAGKLSPEDKLQIEADYWQRAQRREKAIEATGALLRKSPDNPDYLLRLASLQSGPDALATIRKIRNQGAPVSEDPRLDLAEAEAADKASNFQLEMTASQRAADKAAREGASILEARARVHEGWSASILGHIAIAEAAYRRAKELYSNVGDQNGVGSALRGLGLVAEKKGDLVQAEQQLAEAVKIFEGIGSKSNAALAINTRGLVVSSEGKLTHAVELYGESLSICRELQDARCMGRELNNIGYVLFRLGRLPEARAKLEESFKEYKLSGHSYGTSFVLSSMGDVYLAQGLLGKSKAALDESAALSKKVGDRSSQASTEASLAELLAAQGKRAEAEKECRRVIAAETELGESGTAAKNRLLLARIELDEAQGGRAADELSQALPVLARSGRVDEIAIGEALQAEATALMGKRELALSEIEEAMHTLTSTESQLARVRVLLAIGLAEYSCGEHDRAQKAMKELEQTATRCGYVLMAQRAQGYLRTGNWRR